VRAAGRRRAEPRPAWGPGSPRLGRQEDGGSRGGAPCRPRLPIPGGPGSRGEGARTVMCGWPGMPAPRDPGEAGEGASPRQEMGRRRSGAARGWWGWGCCEAGTPGPSRAGPGSHSPGGADGRSGRPPARDRGGAWTIVAAPTPSCRLTRAAAGSARKPSPLH
jgi:hypothetical protein